MIFVLSSTTQITNYYYRLMKKLIIISLCFIYGLGQASAQVGDIFPVLEAETVEDKVITLPQDAKGKFTLVGLAYSKKSEKDLSTWLIPLYNTFIYRPEKPSLFSAFAYDINVYLVPMFTGVKAAATGTAKKQAAENLDPKLQSNLLFYKGSISAYKDSLSFDKKDVPYFFLLDESGKIVYATSGAYSEQKMDDIEDQIVK